MKNTIIPSSNYLTCKHMKWNYDLKEVIILSPKDSLHGL